MDATKPPNDIEVRPLERACGARSEEEALKKESDPLPVALRNEEITERDLEVLSRIAQDANATKGKLKRVPRRIPLRKQEEVNK